MCRSCSLVLLFLFTVHTFVHIFSTALSTVIQAFANLLYVRTRVMIISAIKSLIFCPWLWQHTTPVLRFRYVLPASERTLCGSSASLSTKKEMYITSHSMRSVFNTLLQKRSTLLFLWVTENFYSSCHVTTFTSKLYPSTNL